MKIPSLKPIHLAVIGTLLQIGTARAVIYDFYVAQTGTANGSSVALVDYKYNTSTQGLTTVNSYSLPSGIVGNISVGSDQLTQTADGKSLVFSSYAGAANSGTNAVALFDLGSHTYDSTVTKVAPGSTYRSAYSFTGTRFYGVGSNATGSPGTFVKGGTTVTQIRSAAQTLNTVSSAFGYLYYSRGSTLTSGVYRAPTAGDITTSVANFTALSGTGWDAAQNYMGFSFLGNTDLFVMNLTLNSLQLYTNTTGGSVTSGWNLSTSFDFGTLGLTSPTTLALFDTGGGTAQMFFTTSTGSASSFGEVAWDGTSFSSGSVLMASTSTLFTGVAVPEPSTWLLGGVGLGFVLLRTARSFRGSAVRGG